MSKRRLIRHASGVLLALMLLANLVPVASAQLPTTCTAAAGTGCVQGTVLDSNTREGIAEVVNVLAIQPSGAAVGTPALCGGATGINPLNSLTSLNGTLVTALLAAGVTGANLNCTSVSSLNGRWGFNSVAAAAGGTTYTHIALKVNYQTHTDTVVVLPGGVGAATNAVGQAVQHDFALSLNLGAAGGLAGTNFGTINGSVALTACAPPICTPPNPVTGVGGGFLPPVPPPAGLGVIPPPGTLETIAGTLIVAMALGGAAPGTVVASVATTSAAAGPGAYSLTVPITGAFNVYAINAGGGNTVPNGQQTSAFCVNGQICGHSPAGPVAATPAAGTTVTAGALAMPLKRAPNSNPAGFTNTTSTGTGGNNTGSTQNDIGAFGYVIDLTTGVAVNGVTVTATCTQGNCANNISAVSTNPTTAPPAGAPTAGYYSLGGLTRGAAYTFRVTAVPAGFRIVDSCQVTVVSPPAPIPLSDPNVPGSVNSGTWMDPNLCVQSLGVLQPIPGASVLSGRVVDPIQLNAGAPTALGGVTIVAVRTDASLVGAFISPFTGFTEVTPTTQTDAGGNWVIAGLPPGTYRITAIDNVDVLCLPSGTAPAVSLVSIPGGIARAAQTVGCGHIPASQPPAGQPGILAPPDAVTVVPDIVMPPKPAPAATTLASQGANPVPPFPVAAPANRAPVVASSATSGTA